MAIETTVDRANELRQERIAADRRKYRELLTSSKADPAELLEVAERLGRETRLEFDRALFEELDSLSGAEADFDKAEEEHRQDGINWRQRNRDFAEREAKVLAELAAEREAIETSRWRVYGKFVNPHESRLKRLNELQATVRECGL